MTEFVIHPQSVMESSWWRSVSFPLPVTADNAHLLTLEAYSEDSLINKPDQQFKLRQNQKTA